MKINHKGCQKREKVTINFLLQAVEAYKNWKHTAVVNRHLSHDVKVISSYHYLKCKSNIKLTEILRILNNGLIHSKILKEWNTQNKRGLIANDFNSKML